MKLALEIASWLCLLSGSFFALTAAVGILRLPDFFSRVHGAGILDTLATVLILLGLVLQAGFSLVTVKLIIVLVFLFITGPTAVHALARAALHGGMKPEANDAGETPSNS